MLMDISDVMDCASHSIKKRRGTSYEILFFRDGLNLCKRHSVVQDHCLVVEKHC